MVLRFRATWEFFSLPSSCLEGVLDTPKIRRQSLPQRSRHPKVLESMVTAYKGRVGEGFQTPIHSPPTTTPSYTPPLHHHALQEPSKRREIKIGLLLVLLVIKDLSLHTNFIIPGILPGGIHHRIQPLPS